MRDQNPALSGQFVEGQRKRLEALREQLRGAEAGRLAAARTSRLDYADEAGDAGDKSQDNIQDEVSQGLHDVDQPRLKAFGSERRAHTQSTARGNPGGGHHARGRAGQKLRPHCWG
jgi:hypothetical protein